MMNERKELTNEFIKNIPLTIFEIINELKTYLENGDNKAAYMWLNYTIAKLEELYKSPYISDLDRIRIENLSYKGQFLQIREIKETLELSEGKYKTKYSKLLHKSKRQAEHIKALRRQNVRSNNE